MIVSRRRSGGQRDQCKSAQVTDAATGDKLNKQTSANDRRLLEQWKTIEVQLETGYAPEKQRVVAALRSATAEVDDLLRLMHTPEVMAFLQIRLELKEKVSPPVEQFLDALQDMLFKPLPVIPASVQHHVANLIEGKAGQVGRPKLHPIRAESEQHQRAEKLIREVRRLKGQLAGSNLKAFARYCELYGGKPSSIERRYWEALTLCRKRRQEIAGYVRHAAQLLGEHPIGMAKRILRQKNIT
ncbi:hypothetical protein BRAS3843_1740016 [Bradyrhizobium sp. STM 3843]|uniref:hypothetical protein n=1 Tax=Bradyrhizobium sp. STM 3843 TaxID=551947 RepID=UPI000240B001|nr:hypothetical protein [Bradyrhizobium sp. STM 3843]CCE06524.1 hypothetical protein BRAS3843_1740016 [Bradyrhizobium sp. STM 3843]